jgi:glyoxylase-like metal-dependent hydrolase (beta-lactamase superfamily II)
MKFSDRVFYRKMYFSFPMKEEPALREVYATLLKGNRNILVDCGVSYNYPDIVQMTAEADIKLADIDTVILTHCHGDHTGGLYRLKKENPKLQIWSHPLAKPMIEDIDAQFKIRPVPAYYVLMGGSVPVDRILADNETIDIGFPVKIFHTPGHSNDSLSLYLPEEKLTISGDAIPYIHDLPIYEDLNSVKASLVKLKTLPADYIISAFCGLWDQKKHGDVYLLTEKYIKNIQTSVTAFRQNQPDASIEDMGRYVLKEINVDGLPIPIFIRSIKEHIKAIH